jgi:hypothetical protein
MQIERWRGECCKYRGGGESVVKRKVEGRVLSIERWRGECCK